MMELRQHRLPLRVVLLCAVLLATANGDAQLRKLSALHTASSNSMLSLTTTELRSFIETSPRSYSLLVLFTADAQMCKPCPAMRSSLESIAREYDKLAPRKQASHPMFFAEVKLSPQDQAFLGMYGIRHVPILYRFPKGSSQFPRPLDSKSPDNYPAEQAGISANAIKIFINQLVRAELPFVRGGYSVPFVQTVKLFIPVIACVVGVFALLAIATGAYKSPMLWFGIVMVIYIFSVGGGHYSWIHNTPLFVVNQNGGRDFIAGGSRSQYVAEGFFVSATCVGISASVIIIQHLPHIIPNKSLQTMAGLSMVSMTMIAISALLMLYHLKMPQYLQYE